MQAGLPLQLYKHGFTVTIVAALITCHVKAQANNRTLFILLLWFPVNNHASNCNRYL